MRDGESSLGEHVELVVPSAPRYLRLVRAAALMVAADAGLGPEQQDDLRLAADELASWAMDLAGDQPLRLVLGCQDGVVELEGTTDLTSNDVEQELPDLAVLLLEASVDDHAARVEDGRLTFTARLAAR